MKPLISFLFCLAFHYNCKAQVMVYKTEDPQIYNKTLHWYGFDFSQLRVYDHTKITDANEVKDQICPAWIAYFRKHVSVNNIKLWFMKTHIFDESAVLMDSYKSIDIENFIKIDGGYGIEDSTIERAISNYELSDTEEGLGLVIFPERFSKLDKDASVVSVFFNIKTREVLFANRTIGSWGSYGFIAIYGKAMVKAVQKSKSKYRRAIGY
ncbi:MAG: hypothetical protein ACPGD8_09425 [Flavobacteriales bacterium]